MFVMEPRGIKSVLPTKILSRGRASVEVFEPLLCRVDDLAGEYLGEKDALLIGNL